MLKGLRCGLAFCAAFSSTGCLYSVHHFNTGVLLPAGHSQATLGVGRQPQWRCAHYHTDSTVAEHTCAEYDSAGSKPGAEIARKADIFKGSFNYRLGLKDKWGPFPGAELEWHMEAPTGPMTMEFALNLALPTGNPAPTAASFHHKLGAGWGIGAWADNSFFMEYAASKRLGLPLFFGNLRGTYLATQLNEVLGDDFSQPLPSHRVLVAQAGLGLSFRLPDWPVVPDFLVPQFNLTLPQIPGGEREFRRRDIPLAQWDMNLGFGWIF
ncbi:MAG: hypothetical protein ABIY63_11485 [Fibrobacteria bacterium]